MSHRLIGCLAVLALLAGGISCTRLGVSGPAEQKLAMEELAKADSIPLGWGKLVSVSSVPGIEHWAQLWFQDDEGTIRMLPYNIGDNSLSGQARVIRRH